MENRLLEIEKMIVMQTKKLFSEELDQTIDELEKMFQATGDILAETLYYSLKMWKGFNQRNIKEMFANNSHFLFCAEQLDYGFFIIEAYDWWGIYHAMQSNHLTAFDYFCKAMDALNKYKDTLAADVYLNQLRIVKSNMANCLFEVGENKRALGQFQDIEKLEQISHRNLLEDEYSIFGITILYQNIALCYFYEEMFHESKEYIMKAKKCIQNFENMKDLMESALILEYMITDTLEGEDSSKLLISELEKIDLDSITYDFFPKFLEYLLKVGEYALFEKMFHLYEDKTLRAENIYSLIAVKEIKRKYCILIEDFAEIDKVYMELGRLYVKRDEIQYETMSKSIATYIEISEKQKEMERSKEILKQKSEHDELTGIPNRYKLNEFFEKVHTRAVEEQQYLSVEIIDADFFKQINDNYGHAQGDICLKCLANEIKKTITDPQNEIGARYGGDEFVIVRLGRTDEEIEAHMESLKQAILDLAIPNEYSLAANVFTVSQGAVNIIPKEDDDLTELLKIADEALYKAKKASKNTVVLCRRV